MPVTKVDEKGRVMLPKEIRRQLRIRSGDEFLISQIDKGMILLKHVDVEAMFKEIIEHAKDVDMKNLDRLIEEEGNKLASRLIADPC